MKKCLGMYNAYVENGKDKKERQRRFDEVPAELKKGVLSHLRTVKAIKEKKR